MDDLQFEPQSTFSMDPIELEKMINVLDLRYNYGYSQIELAFLIGLRDLYIRDVKNPLHTLQYSVPNNNSLIQLTRVRLHIGDCLAKRVAVKR